MTTSNVRIYQLTRNELITAALSTLGVLAKGQVPSTEDYTTATIKLNMLIALLRTKQLPLWARTEYVMSLTSGNNIYTIGEGQTIDTPFPLKVLEAYSIGSSSSSRIPMNIISSDEYNILPTNTSSGQPLQLNYQPYINYGQLKIWPTPDTTVANTYTILLVYQAPFEYFNSSSDTLSFPEEYYLPIIYKLAVLLAPDWGIPLEDRRDLKAEAKEYMDMVDSFGTEDASLFLSPTRR